MNMLAQGILNAVFPPTLCDDCGCEINPVDHKKCVMTDPWGIPTGNIYCDGCQEKRYDRYMEKLAEET